MNFYEPKKHLQQHSLYRLPSCDPLQQIKKDLGVYLVSCRIYRWTGKRHPTSTRATRTTARKDIRNIRYTIIREKVNSIFYQSAWNIPQSGHSQPAGINFLSMRLYIRCSIAPHFGCWQNGCLMSGMKVIYIFERFKTNRTIIWGDFLRFPFIEFFRMIQFTNTC